MTIVKIIRYKYFFNSILSLRVSIESLFWSLRAFCAIHIHSSVRFSRLLLCPKCQRTTMKIFMHLRILIILGLHKMYTSLILSQSILLELFPLWTSKFILIVRNYPRFSTKNHLWKLQRILRETMAQGRILFPAWLLQNETWQKVHFIWVEIRII